MEKTNHGKTKPILLLIGLIVFLAFLFLPLQKVSAIGLILPFGGKISATKIDGVSCIGIGPITITPANLAPPTPYVISLKTEKYLYVWPAKKAYIIGLYNLVPNINTCFVEGVPIPVFEIKMYGVSFK